MARRLSSIDDRHNNRVVTRHFEYHDNGRHHAARTGADHRRHADNGGRGWRELEWGRTEPVTAAKAGAQGAPR